MKADVIACDEYNRLNPPNFYIYDDQLVFVSRKRDSIANSATFTLFTEDMLIIPYAYWVCVNWDFGNALDTAHKYWLEPYGFGYIVVELLDKGIKSHFEHFRFEVSKGSDGYAVCVSKELDTEIQGRLVQAAVKHGGSIMDGFMANFFKQLIDKRYERSELHVEYQDFVKSLEPVKIREGEIGILLKIHDKYGSSGITRIGNCRFEMELNFNFSSKIKLATGKDTVEVGSLVCRVQNNLIGGFEILRIERIGIDLNCNAVAVARVAYAYPRVWENQLVDRHVIEGMIVCVTQSVVHYVQEPRARQHNKLGGDELYYPVKGFWLDKNLLEGETPEIRDFTDNLKVYSHDKDFYVFAEEDGDPRVYAYKRTEMVRSDGKFYWELRLDNKSGPEFERRLKALAQIEMLKSRAKSLG